MPLNIGFEMIDQLMYFRAKHAMMDLHLCRNFVERIQWKSPLDLEINQALEIAFIVTYARNFVGGNERIRAIPSSLPERVLSDLNEPEHELHLTILKTLRNRVVAHTELGFIKPEIELRGRPTEPRGSEHKNAFFIRHLDDAQLRIVPSLLSKVELQCFHLVREFEHCAPPGKYDLSQA